MMHLRTYTDPMDLVQAIEPALLEREIENNMILGGCALLRQSASLPTNAALLQVVEDHSDALMAALIHTCTGITHIGGAGGNAHAAELLADYCRAQQVDIKSIFGEAFWAKNFAHYYNRPIAQEIQMRVHRLADLSSVAYPSGKLALATDADITWITEWSSCFEEDAHIFPRRSDEQLRALTRSKIEKGHIVKWMDGDQPVSIAAFMRSTPQAAYIGLVYTPPAQRGKGYATACVHAFSRQLLTAQGYRYCGLFTDLSNPTSNHIYRKIGYMPLGEYSDVQFVRS